MMPHFCAKKWRTRNLKGLSPKTSGAEVGLISGDYCSPTTLRLNRNNVSNIMCVVAHLWKAISQLFLNVRWNLWAGKTGIRLLGDTVSRENLRPILITEAKKLISWCANYLCLLVMSRVVIFVESESSKIFSNHDLVELEWSHKCQVTSSHWFASSSQFRVTWNFTFFLGHFLCYKMAPNKLENGAQHAMKWCPMR